MMVLNHCVESVFSHLSCEIPVCVHVHNQHRVILHPVLTIIQSVVSHLQLSICTLYVLVLTQEKEQLLSETLENISRHKAEQNKQSMLRYVSHMFKSY